MSSAPPDGSSAGVPPLSADERAHGELVLAHLRREIAEASGWIPFADYMNAALYAPGLGYYAAGARKFGNILDPNSEVSYILRTKKVFIQLKEETGNNPRFYYYFDV